MNKNITLYQNLYQSMDEIILQKYSLNIKNVINSLHIIPKNYTLRSNKEKTFAVYFFYYRVGETKRRKFQKSEITINGVRLQINRVNDFKEKIKLIEALKESVAQNLKENPTVILGLIYGSDKAKELYPSLYFLKTKEDNIISIEDAFNKVLENKKNNISTVYYGSLRSVKNRFLKHIGKTKKDTTNLLNKKIVITFLNEATKNISNRSYNN